MDRDTVEVRYGKNINAGEAQDVLANYHQFRAALKDSCQRQWTKQEEAKVLSSTMAIADQLKRWDAYVAARTAWRALADTTKVAKPLWTEMPVVQYLAQPYPAWLQ